MQTPAQNRIAFGYVKTSATNDRKARYYLQIQQIALEKGWDDLCVLEEDINEKGGWQERKIGEIILRLETGGHLIIPDLSHLGRSLIECLEIIIVLAQRRISTYSIHSECFIDFNTPHGFEDALRLVVEIERNLISQRSREALQKLKQKGVKLGAPPGPRKSKLDEFEDQIIQLMNDGVSLSDIAVRFSTTRVNLSLWLDKKGIAKPRERARCRQRVGDLLITTHERDIEIETYGGSKIRLPKGQTSFA